MAKKANQETGLKKGLSKIIITIISVIIVGIGSLLGFGGDDAQNSGVGENELVNIIEQGESDSDVEFVDEDESAEDVIVEEESQQEEPVIENGEEAVSEEFGEEVSEEQSEVAQEVTVAEITFRNDNLLNQHYDKHGIEMGFDSAQEYELAAYKVIIHPDTLHKIEAEDGDDVYYLEATNEFVVVSQDGYIRTYFYPSAGIDYYNRQ